MGAQNSGNQPNLLRNAIHMDVLRQHERLIALPPVDSVLCVSPVSFRYVRQEHAKAETLHKGVLSSRSIVGATGLCEDSTCKFLTSWPQFMVNHDAAREAARRLQSLQESCFIATPEQTAAAIKVNDRAMHRYNRNKLRPFQAALRRRAPASPAADPDRNAPPPAPPTSPPPAADPPTAPSTPPSQQTPNKSGIAAASAAEAVLALAPCARGTEVLVANPGDAKAATSAAQSPTSGTERLISDGAGLSDWSEDDLQELQRRGLDPGLLGQQVQVSLASVTGPGQRRTLVCSLSEARPTATKPAPPSPQQNEWLKGVPAVARAAARVSSCGSAKRRSKAKRKSKSGALQRGRSATGQQSSQPGGVSDTESSRDCFAALQAGAAFGTGAAEHPQGAPEAVQGDSGRNVPVGHDTRETDESLDYDSIPAEHGDGSDAGVKRAARMAAAAAAEGLVPVRPVEAVPHAELVARASQPWRIPHTMAAEFGNATETKLRTTWGQEQEAAALLEVLHIFSGSTLHEVGLCMLDPQAIPEEWGVPVELLPPIGSSPDGLIYHPPPAPPPTGDPEHAESSPRGPGGCAEPESPEARIKEVARAAVQRQRAVLSGGRRWQPEVYDAIALPGCWEVVEVKNHCPFKEAAGPGRRRWTCCDTGPRAAPPEQYVPQLQLEMLCTGLPSALLVSRSATRGTHIFRMWRNDRYCALLLRLAATFYQSFGRHGCRSPPPNFFASSPVYHEFCRTTQQLRAHTPLLCHLDADDAPFDQSQPLFL
eukprot:jgi/Ulvmu1/1214/UM109_0012.1